MLLLPPAYSAFLFEGGQFLKTSLFVVFSVLSVVFLVWLGLVSLLKFTLLCCPGWL